MMQTSEQQQLEKVDAQSMEAGKKLPASFHLSDEATDVEIQMYDQEEEEFELYDCTEQIQITNTNLVGC